MEAGIQVGIKQSKPLRTGLNTKKTCNVAHAGSSLGHPNINSYAVSTATLQHYLSLTCVTQLTSFRSKKRNSIVAFLYSLQVVSLRISVMSLHTTFTSGLPVGRDKASLTGWKKRLESMPY